jgi:hypothetical protein
VSTHNHVLHLYANSAIDWFAAESVEAAVAMARELYSEHECDPDDMDLIFEQVPDDKILGLRDGAELVGRKPAGQWARENGPGFFATTND